MLNGVLLALFASETATYIGVVIGNAVNGGNSFERNSSLNGEREVRR